MRKERNDCIDITGQQFGRWFVKYKVDNHNKKGTCAYWFCECECGNTEVLSGITLRNGHTKSCGCYKKDYLWKGYGEISGCYWKRLVRSAEKRDIEFKITIEFAWDLYLKQNRLCALSSFPISFVRQYMKNWEGNTASLDRIDSDGNYTENNVQWVHRDINQMRNRITVERFVEICKSVAKTFEGKK